MVTYVLINDDVKTPVSQQKVMSHVLLHVSAVPWTLSHDSLLLSLSHVTPFPRTFPSNRSPGSVSSRALPVLLPQYQSADWAADQLWSDPPLHSNAVVPPWAAVWTRSFHCSAAVRSGSSGSAVLQFQAGNPLVTTAALLAEAADVL